jgi:hypothetical protein
MANTVHLLQEQFRHLWMVETANELPTLLRNAEKNVMDLSRVFTRNTYV